MGQPIVLIVPGIGDDESGAYKVFEHVWRRRGFDARILVFGWNDIEAPLASKMVPFLEYIRELEELVYIIGVSAGGMAAVHALAACPNVQKIITVCSPLDRMPKLHNPLLQASIEQTREDLRMLTSDQRSRFLTVYPLYDQVVPTRLAHTPGVRRFRICSVVHAPSIFVALTLYSRSLARFFKK